MILVIHDANVLIDLQVGLVLDEFFQLGWQSHTTEAVLDEVSQPLDDYVADGRLKVRHLSGDELVELALLRHQQPRRISVEDCSLLRLAEELHAALLTGDANLRFCAERVNLEVHGTLWILDALVAGRVMSPSRVVAALERMLAAGRRLPRQDCEERLKKWRTT